jgi:tungstate transport system substrate-binding protein
MARGQERIEVRGVHRAREDTKARDAALARARAREILSACATSRRFLMRSRSAFSYAAAALLALAPVALRAERPFITLATTTSTQDSGLLEYLLPKFTTDTGIEVRVVAVGTGRALELGKRGDADVLLVHDRAAEELFVKDRHALERRDVMYNDFLVVGPATDPANVGDVHLASAAFSRISDKQATFVSRGDDSGTHKAEQRLWAAAGRDPRVGSGKWYLEAGGGMAATLAMAGEKRAYTLTDRASWLALPNRRGLLELLAGDPSLRNNYGVMVVNDFKHKGVKFALGKKLADWLTSYQGRTLIAKFRVADKQVFFVN